MIVTVQFKNKDKVFSGKTYDYILNKNEKVPKQGSIIRMMDKNYNYICNGTRVKVVALRKEKFSDSLLTEIKYVTSTLD